MSLVYKMEPFTTSRVRINSLSDFRIVFYKSRQKCFLIMVLLSNPIEPILFFKKYIAEDILTLV